MSKSSEWVAGLVLEHETPAVLKPLTREAPTMPDYNLHKVTAMALGSVCSGLGCYGAFEFAHKLEGAFSYLVIAAPVVALTAALIPPLAEATWRSGAYLKAFLWWAALIPAAAVVFYSATERVHAAKASGEAERAALRSAVTRAQTALAEAKTEYAKAQAEADKVRGWRECGPKCTGIKATAEAKRELAVEAEAKLVKAESVAKQEAPLKAPAWLLSAALDAVAFMAIWTGLSTGSVKQRRAEPASKRRRRVQRPKVVIFKRSVRRMAANDNVVPLSAA
jgi:hypothetical protein